MFTKPLVSWLSYTSTPHNSLPKHLAAFPHGLLGHWWKTNDACCINLCQTFERMLAELEFELQPLDWQPTLLPTELRGLGVKKCYIKAIGHILVTLSIIQQFCSRRLWKHIGKNLKNLMSYFTFGHNVFESRLLLLRQNASLCGKGFFQLYSMIKLSFIDILFSFI